MITTYDLPTKYNNADLPLLFGTEPKGVGTSQVESLTSFICRLAERRSLRAGQLWFDAIKHYRKIDPSVPKKYDFTYRVNGSGIQAKVATHAFSACLTVPWARGLTMAQLEELIEPRMHGLLRTHLAYCSDCVREDSVHDETYIRLLWLLKPVHACTKHRRLLQEVCPSCNAPLPIVPWLTNPLFCMHCRQDISDLPVNPQEEPTDYQIWVAHHVGRLFELTSNGEHQLEQGCFQKALGTVVDKHFRGSNQLLGKHLGLSTNYIRMYRLGHIRPTFPKMLRILRMLNTTPEDFFLTKNGALNIDVPKKIPREPTIKRACIILTPEMKADIRNDLDKVLTDEIAISATELAARHKRSLCNIRYHFPDKYKALIERYKSQQLEKRARTREERIKRVTAVAQGLLDRGIYPSQRKLKATGKVIATDLTRKDVRRALAQIRGNYHYRQPIFTPGTKTKKQRDNRT